MMSLELPENLSGPLAPIGSFLLASRDVKTLADSIVARHDPARAPHFYGFEIWPGLGDAALQRYERMFALSIPEPYRAILMRINGATLGALFLYGVPVSMLADPPLLDRTRRQPLDLSTANALWRREFPSHAHLFHFGSVLWSETENAGVFLSDNGGVEAALPTGETVLTFTSLSGLIDFGLSSLGT
jgi:hypothetical protein